jgi:K+-sensing histidine kinase KdpD
MTAVPVSPPRADHELPSTNNHVAACLNLSHELRTPTNAILGHVELLLSGSSGPISVDTRKSLGEIQTAALALHTQLDRLVRLAEGLPMPNVDPTMDKPDGEK